VNRPVVGLRRSIGSATCSRQSAIEIGGSPRSVISVLTYLPAPNRRGEAIFAAITREPDHTWLANKKSEGYVRRAEIIRYPSRRRYA
jgi:hypothetical protein